MSWKSQKDEKYSWMSNHELSKVLKDIPEFLGVFPKDKIPHHISNYPCGLVMNTADGDQPGEHWVAAYFHTPCHAVFFCSYGRHPNYYNLNNFMERNAVTYSYNNQRLQSNITAYCGAYCIYFIRMISSGRLVTILYSMIVLYSTLFTVL